MQNSKKKNLSGILIGFSLTIETNSGRIHIFTVLNLHMQLETFWMFLFIQVLSCPLARFIFIIKTFRQTQK